MSERAKAIILTVAVIVAILGITVYNTMRDDRAIRQHERQLAQHTCAPDPMYPWECANHHDFAGDTGATGPPADLDP